MGNNAHCYDVLCPQYSSRYALFGTPLPHTDKPSVVVGHHHALVNVASINASAEFLTYTPQAMESLGCLQEKKLRPVGKGYLIDHVVGARLAPGGIKATR